MLCRKIITVMCDNQMKHTHTHALWPTRSVLMSSTWWYTQLPLCLNQLTSLIQVTKILSCAVRDTQTAQHITRGIKTNAINMVKRHTSFERDCTSPFDLPAKSICYLEDRKVTMAPQNFDGVRSQRCSLDCKAVCTETAGGQRLGLFDADVSQDGSNSHTGPAYHESPLKGMCVQC